MPQPSLQPADQDYAAKVSRSFSEQGLMRALKASLSVVGPGHCRIECPYSPAVSQQDGFFHAGAVGALADTVAGYAAYTLMPPGSRVLTVEFKINLLSPAQGPRLVGEGAVVKAGRTLTVCRSEMRVGGDAPCAIATVTLMCVRQR